MTIKAIIFDCFGVLTSEGWLPFKRRYFGGEQGLEQQATDLSKRLNSGHISYDAFITEVAELAGIPKSEAAQAIQQNVADEELFGYIREKLKPTYKLAILSNAGGDRLHQLFTPDQLALFENAALSFETGYVKPDARAYQHIVAKLGVEAEECVFIDDQERHVSGARDAGMHAILYHDLEQLRHELEPLL